MPQCFLGNQATKENLPTLKELVDSDVEIIPGEMYYTIEKEDTPGNWAGREGHYILRMREIGIDAAQEESYRKFREKAGMFCPPQHPKFHCPVRESCEIKKRFPFFYCDIFKKHTAYWIER